jgi:deazaflavin-dependent oxidoreductase (nitroreductase family)
MATVEERFASAPYCYLLTAGRRSGKPHEIEIWFVAQENTLYLLNGAGKRPAGMSDWIHNLRGDPMCRVRVSGVVFNAIARFPVPDGPEDRAMRTALFSKYAASEWGDLTGWRDTGILVALDLTGERRASA